MKTTADRLLFAREAKGWSQGKLALNAGLSQSTVGNIEAGIRQSRGSLPKIAKALGVSHDWLADGIGDMKPVRYELQSQSAATGPTGATPSAVELSKLFDLIPEAQTLKRARAYNAAAAAILDVLQETPPTD